jgi:hypothetical protein
MLSLKGKRAGAMAIASRGAVDSAVFSVDEALLF